MGRQEWLRYVRAQPRLWLPSLLPTGEGLLPQTQPSQAQPSSSPPAPPPSSPPSSSPPSSSPPAPPPSTSSTPPQPAAPPPCPWERQRLGLGPQASSSRQALNRSPSCVISVAP